MKRVIHKWRFRNDYDWVCQVLGPFGTGLETDKWDSTGHLQWKYVTCKKCLKRRKEVSS